MAIMVMDTVKKSKLATTIAASLFLQPVLAGEWIFTPQTFIVETFTDNVELNYNEEISSLVSQTGIAIDTSYIAKKINFNLTSQSLYAFYSHDHDLDDDYHTVASDLTIELWPKGLSLIGKVNIDRRAKNQAQNALADIISGDTIKIETYTSGFQYNVVNNKFSFNSSISYSDIQSEDDIGNREGYIATVNSQNGAGIHNVFWTLNSSYQEVKNNQRSSRMYNGEIKLGLITSYKINPFLRYYDEENNGNIGGNQALESNSYGAGFRWLITPRFELDLSYNQPIGNALDSHGDEQKEYISSSINWQPSERTQLTASISQRFYGDSYSFAFTHQNKRLTNSINYVEDVQTLTRNNYIPFELGTFFCPNQGRILLSECYIEGDINFNFENFDLVTFTDFNIEEDDQYSLNKTLTWKSTLSFSRTTFTLNILGSTRENLSNYQQNENSRADFTVSRKVSGKSKIDFKLSYTDNTFEKDSEDERRDRYRQYQVNLERSLNSKLALNFSLGLVNRDSNETLFNYEEGRVTLKFTKDF
ncbi:TIGR03016 family PEP-CTERM system-associated outer membrane protein [Thalassotalea castellviae]|uniref:TIGR03016 family PEP-CTERM system-associated outer membrane protein n=1 Tax=Thalassotalea castellviae TaxID=3075612 RepID=A0ABU3A0W9_9GAMM|nr:TIGR03016 family PEP-CTERM system-associated outer membrane protein [Thalassotalea sp. W431]MDT0603821.1 TIGR03016 family PEP-CTERM system-associated outer membrane protein [Thalassotalea sp. W431]